MKHNQQNHYSAMFFIMILSGLLTTMNVWVDKWEDIRFSINDIYMTLLMTGWMFLFMGIYYSERIILWFGLFLVVTTIWCIRTQFMITNTQYILGMIPHHSMAILMSKRILQHQPPLLHEFVYNIIKTQEEEIEYMKKMYSKSIGEVWSGHSSKRSTLPDCYRVEMHRILNAQAGGNQNTLH